MPMWVIILVLGALIVAVLWTLFPFALLYLLIRAIERAEAKDR